MDGPEFGDSLIVRTWRPESVRGDSCPFGAGCAAGALAWLLQECDGVPPALFLHGYTVGEGKGLFELLPRADRLEVEADL